MKKTEISKLKFLQYLASLKKLTPVKIGQLREDFKLGYPSLCLDILDLTGWIDKVKEGGRISVRWISKQYPDPQLAKFLHIQLREELDKRYPEKYSKKKEEVKLARKEQGERVLSITDISYTKEEEEEMIKAIRNSNGAPQLLLPLDDLSTEAQKQKAQIQKIKINLLNSLTEISLDFQKKINDIAKKINAINTIMILVLSFSFFSCSPSGPEEEVIEDPVEILSVKFTAIEAAPDSVKALYKEFDKIISGEQLTDIIPPEMKAEVYALRFHKLAQEEERLYNIPSCITLAQGILESRSGESKLATKNNNHFGIKCFSKKCKKGHCSNYTDDSHKDFFMNYKSVKESYRAHSEFLQRSRYSKLKKCKNYKDYARNLKRCGYATDPNYAKHLINIIRRYDLTKYNLK